MRKLKAFTLLEIVIALAIFTIGLVGLLSLFPVAFHASKRATDLTEATIYAQQKIEELKRGGYDNLPPEDVTPGTDPPVDTGSFDSRFNWSLYLNTVSTGLKKIKLTVDWTEGGKSYDEDFVTYMADLTPTP